VVGLSPEMRDSEEELDDGDEKQVKQEETIFQARNKPAVILVADGSYTCLVDACLAKRCTYKLIKSTYLIAL
jgi:nitrite reductase/ring-hydroxylating ferredoxin subunit